MLLSELTEAQREMGRLKDEVGRLMPNNPVLSGWASYSQCDEDGIIRECLRKIALKEKLSGTFVEVGCGHGLQNNTYQLILDGFSGVWIDGESSNIAEIEKALGGRVFPRLLIEEIMVTRDSSLSPALRAKRFLGVDSVDFLSVDIDGNDLHVCGHLIANLQPKLVCVEYNAKFPPPTSVVMEENDQHLWRNDDYFGASLQAWVDWFTVHAYELVCCNLSGVNAFFVDKRLIENFTSYSINELYMPARYQLANLPNGHKASYAWLKQQLNSSGSERQIFHSRKKRLLADANYGPMFVYESDNVIGRSLMNAGGFQEGKIVEVVDFLKERFKYIPELFVDIGANIGTHSVFSLKSGLFRNAICFEPDEDNYRLLVTNLEINGLSSIVDCYQLALSDATSSIEMELSQTNYGDHRIQAKNNEITFGEESERQVVKVECITLDDFVREKGNVRVNVLVWMDTQGHEGQIFHGGMNFFSNISGNNFVVTEFWPYGLERSGGKEMYFDFLRRCARIYDTGKPNWQTGDGVTIDALSEMYSDMLSKTQKEYHPHTDLLLIH